MVQWCDISYDDNHFWPDSTYKQTDTFDFSRQQDPEDNSCPMCDNNPYSPENTTYRNLIFFKSEMTFQTIKKARKGTVLLCKNSQIKYTAMETF